MEEKLPVEFNFTEFEKIKYEDRVKILELKNFGDSGETVTWKIKNLDSSDLAAIEDGLQKNKSLLEMTDVMIEAISESGKIKEKKEALKTLIGLDEKVSSDLLRNYIAFELGSIKPKPGSRQTTLKFAKVYPLEFKRIVNEIFFLTGKGAYAKKKPFIYGSGQMSDTI